MRLPLFPIAILGLLVALVACRAGDPASPTAPPSASPEAQPPALEVALADFTITPKIVETGSNVTIDVVNEGPTPHNLTIRDAEGQVLLATADLRRDSGETLTGQLPAGEYVMFCSLAGHESLGMRGVFTVKGP